MQTEVLLRLFVSHFGFFSIFFLLGLCQTISAQQTIAIDDFKLLISNEKVLSKMADKFTEDSLLGEFAQDSVLIRKKPLVYDSIASELRLKACYEFIPQLVKSLKIPNSFYFHFPMIDKLSVLYAPDSSFRIISWQIRQRLATYRYFGLIQLNQADLKLFPLLDVSDTLPYQTQQRLSSKNWYGALYYKILQNEGNGKSYYTLLGFDGGDLWSNRKIIEVLSFDKGEPLFGAPVFFFEDTATGPRTQNRVFIEYKNSANVGLNFDRDSQMIIYDHVAPSNEKEKEAKFTYVPDGTYEGLRWIENRWVWKEQVYKSIEGANDNPPVPNPKYNGGGTGYDPEKQEVPASPEVQIKPEAPKATDGIPVVPKGKKNKKIKSITNFPG